MANIPTVSAPLQKFENITVSSLLSVSGSSSLFIGTKQGDILEWEQPGEVKRTLKGHTNWVSCLLQCGDRLWSGSEDKTFRVWNIHTGECLNIVEEVEAVYYLGEWRGDIVSSGAYAIRL